jgi:hypothetical protein
MRKQPRPRWAVIRAINRANYWRKKWQAIPDQMEKARKTATKLAAKARHDQRKNIKEDLSKWPTIMSSKDFKDRIGQYIPKGYVPKSFINRLRRYGFISYCAADAVWINLCSQGNGQDPLSFSQE